MEHEFGSLDSSSVQTAFALFVDDGDLNDENSKLGAHVVENSAQELEDAFNARGYCGAAIEGRGQSYSEYGSVYWLFDPDQASPENAWGWRRSATEPMRDNAAVDFEIAEEDIASLRIAQSGTDYGAASHFPVFNKKRDVKAG